MGYFIDYVDGVLLVIKCIIYNECSKDRIIIIRSMIERILKEKVCYKIVIVELLESGLFKIMYEIYSS